MKERDKRRHSIIVKGLKATSPTDFASKFGQLAEELTGSKMDLSETSVVTGHAKIYRTKIIDDNQRKLLLDKAKMLKGSPYESVFISRDLTYAQRSEMFLRRQAWKAQNAAQGHADGSGATSQGATAQGGTAQGVTAQGATAAAQGAAAQGATAQGATAQGSAAQGATGTTAVDLAAADHVSPTAPIRVGN